MPPRNDKKDYTTKNLIPIPPQIVRSQTLPNRSSALAGAAVTTPALAEPFIASDAAVGFWSLFSYRKRTSPRGNERKSQKNTEFVWNSYYHSKVFSTHHNILNLNIWFECSKWQDGVVWLETPVRFNRFLHSSQYIKPQYSIRVFAMTPQANNYLPH